MKLQVVFSAEKEPDFVSKTIMERDKVSYSHVLILIDGKTIFHATGEGVHTEDADKYFQTHIAVHTFDIKLLVMDQYFQGFVRGAKGKEYSQSQLAAIAVGRDDQLNGDEKMICSELVGLVLTEMCGYKLSGNQDYWRPIHCYNALKEGIV